VSCPVCSCPAAQTLLVSTVCANPDCTNHDFARCEWDKERDLINGANWNETNKWLDKRVGMIWSTVHPSNRVIRLNTVIEEELDSSVLFFSSPSGWSSTSVLP